MRRPHELVDAEADENDAPHDFERVDGYDGAPYDDHANHKRDGRGMAEEDGRERAEHRAPAALLESQRDREQPAHGRVDAVIRAEGREGDPGPQVG